MGSRTWIKQYPERWIKGSLRKETPELRGFWADVLALAGQGSFGDSGEIKLADNISLTDIQIAGVLNVPVDSWLKAKERLILTERISVNGQGVIKIVNWSKYQSEYQRQRDYQSEYHKRKLSTQTINANTVVNLQGEGEGEGEGEKIEKRIVPPIIPLKGDNTLPEKQTKKHSQEKKQSYGLANNILLSEEEHNKLLEKFGGPGALERIDKLSAYIGSIGKKYKNHYMTILSWELRGDKNVRANTNKPNHSGNGTERPWSEASTEPGGETS